MAKQVTASIFHTTCWVAYSWALYIELFHFAYYYYSFAFKFATVWFNLYLVLYHLCAALKSALEQRESEVKIHSTILRLLTLLEDRMFASIIFPQSPLICVTFWTCYCIDPVKAVPLHVQRDKYWIYATHLQHTLIVLTMLVDLLAKQHQYPSKIEGIRTMLVFSVGYNILLTIRGIVYNDWTYSFFSQMDGVSVFAAYVCGNLLLVATYCLGDFLNSVRSRWVHTLLKATHGNSSGQKSTSCKKK